MAGFLGRIARRALGPVGRVAGRVAVPVLRTAFRASPLGAVAGLAAGGYAAYQALTGGGQGGGVAPPLPQLPMLPQGAMMAGMDTGAGGGPAMDAFQLQISGKRSIAMPAMTIDMIRQLEAAGLMTGFASLRTYRRSPRKDQVVVHPIGADGQVATFALNKRLARAWQLWKPARKPPMSAGTWNAVQKANRAVDILRKMNTEVKKVSNFGQKARSQLRVYEAPGKKFLGRRAA